MSNGVRVSSSPPPRLHRVVAIWCGAVPLFLGITTFACWLATRRQLFLTLGFYDLVIGLCFVGLGVILLVRYIWIEHRRASTAARPVAELGPLPLLILLSNVPVGAVLVALTYAFGLPYELEVVNRTSLNISSIVVNDDAGIQVFGPLAPGEHQSCIVNSMLGSFQYSATAANGNVIDEGKGSSDWDDCNSGVTIEITSEATSQPTLRQ